MTLVFKTLKINTFFNTEDLTEKARKWCAWQDRCSFELSLKLKNWGASYGQIRTILEKMADEGFIDEQRFARLFVRGKFKNNQWGRLKIFAALKAKKIPDVTIKEALSELDETDYQMLAEKLALKKYDQLKEDDNSKVMKTAAYLASKGFENQLIFDIINKLKS